VPIRIRPVVTGFSLFPGSVRAVAGEGSGRGRGSKDAMK
jgi:hypothetical protein